MNDRLRLLVFLVACAIIAPGAWAIVRGMPTFGAHPLPYGDLVNRVAPDERHVTNMVSAVNFDYRGVDTLGEEFMLVCAVTGIAVLLRGKCGEDPEARPGVVPGRAVLARSEASLLAARWIAPLTVLFGVYVAEHAMTTPGGGFQGGVIIATGILLLFVSDGYRPWRKAVPSAWFDAAEGAGATLYAAAGLASMCRGAPFLTNELPFGTLGDVFSGGLMWVENAGVTLAVMGGFVVTFGEFLEETRIEASEQP